MHINAESILLINVFRTFSINFNYFRILINNILIQLFSIYSGFLHDVESLAAQYEECVSFGKTKEKNRLLRKAQSTLLSARELGDEKLQIVQHLQDLIENRTRLLDNDYRNIGKLNFYNFYFKLN